MTIQTNHATSVACFITSFVLEGIQRCSGIFFSWTLDQSEDSRQNAAIPFVVSRATAYIVSVVFKDFLRHQEVEAALQCGVFLGILGAALSFISSDFIWMTICWGIIFGAGIGISSPEPLKVSQTFRTQPFILLICCAAPSFACILLPYFLQFLLSCYGLCGCLLIVSGITLNAAPFIMVASYMIRFQLRKPLWRIRKKYEIKDVESNIHHAQNTRENDGIDNECFEIEASSISGQSDANSSIVEKDSSLHKTIFLLDNSNISLIKDINTENTSDNQIVATSRKSNGLLPICVPEEDFNEVVLFELTSETVRNKINSNCSKNGDFKNSLADSTRDERAISCRCRKNTIVNSLPKHSKNAISNATVLYQHETSASAKKSQTTHSIESTNNLLNNGILRSKLSDTPSIHTSTHQNGLMKTQSNLMRNSYPLEIKVHVVECTFTEDDVRDGRLLTQSVPNSNRCCYRRHSNSLITSQYSNINFSSPSFSKKYGKSSNLYSRSSNPSPNMYLISEDDELAVDMPTRNNDALSSTTVGQQRKQTASTLKKIFKPACLIVIYAFVIHEVTLVTLLTIFDDHIDGLVSPATGVLPAFGLGGILGRLSVKYWGDRLLLEGSHATAALLFILDGVVVAGILWSPNIYWIGGFYAAVGFLEIGISTAVWNLVSDHIEVDAKSALFAACKFLCGICSLFVPYTIGLSRDVMGDYDDLLQVTSGLSVLCAILCYILPKFTFHTRNTRGS